MATLSELIETIAKVEGMDPATVRLIARNVREAGLITTGGRGPSAGKMTVPDAVNLLIAVNASDKIGEAPQTVFKYRRLEAHGRFTGRRFKLVDALEQLIKAAANKALPEQYVFDPVPPLIADDFSKGQAVVVVSFHRPVPIVQIGVFTSWGIEGVNWWGEFRPGVVEKHLKHIASIGYEFRWPGSRDSRRWKHLGDRYDTTSIRFPTLQAIGQLFPPESASATSPSALRPRGSKR